jgi:LPS-assembly protein
MIVLMHPLNYRFHGSGKLSSRGPFPAPGRLVCGTCLLCLMLLLIYGTAWGQNPDNVLGNTQFPWHITADELNFDETNQVYIATGNVVIKKMDKKISADSVQFDHKKMIAHASGNVVMTVDRDTIAADSLRIDLNTEAGTIQNGSFFLYKENFHIKGKQIIKTGRDSYYADKASLTSCDGKKPAWKITARKLNITIEGYGYARHAVFWVKNIPVFYTPFIAFPVKSLRQTGLLPPHIGTSSRKGFYYHQPLFWAINDSMDATFYDHFMELRGNKLGAELRYIAGAQTKGTLMLDYFEDSKVDDGVGDNSRDWGYDDALDDAAGADDDNLRPNRDRYWFRMKHDQALPWHFSAKLDLDVVSDQDYLKEFKSGYTGYKFSDDYYNDEFNRDIDDYNDPVRLNRLNFSRNWSRFNLNTEFRWYDDVISRQQEDRDLTVQRLPFVRLDAPKQQLGTSLFYGTMLNEYTYFYRENTNTANSVLQDHRLHIYPRVYLPLNWLSYFTLEPSMGLRATYWQVVACEDPAEDRDDSESYQREIPDYQVDLSTEFYRIFNTDLGLIDRMKHVVRPHITYTYVPEEDQSDYPYFDSRDRIEKENTLTYSLTNLFTYRSRIMTGKPSVGVTTVPEYNYQQIVRLFVEQSYDFNEAAADDPAEWENGETQEPFSPVYGRLELTPEKYITLQADAEWSPYENDLISHSASTVLSDKRGDRLTVEHRYKQDIPNIDQSGLESAYAKLRIAVTDALSATAEYEKDLFEDQEILASVGALYKAQCWSLQLTYTREDDEEKYDFMIGLHGLGEIESGL